MTVETDLVTAVTGDATLSGLIGARFYPAPAPASASYPLMAYQVISRVVEGGTCYSTRIQMTIVDDSYATVKSVRDAVQSLAEAKLGWVYVEGSDGYELEEGIWRQTIDVIIYD